MKITAKIFSIILLLCILCTAAACSAEKGDLMDGADNLYPAPDYPATDFPTESSPENEVDPSDEPEPSFKENPFVSTEIQNISTFSADVDTASYTYFRKLVNSGYTLYELSKASTAFRTEEFINYFDYDVKTPDEGQLFGVDARIIPCAWNTDNVLLKLTLQADGAVESEGNNLVFLIDVSGSMSSDDKLPLLKESFSCLVGNLSEDDRVSIVTYSGRECVVLDGCKGDKGEMIMAAINSLTAGGSTNGEAGLTEAYRIAEKHYIKGGNNRIIMASDGDLNVGISSSSELKNYISGKRDQGVYLSVLGFGTGNYRDQRMEALADNGNGVYYYIDGISEAERVLGTDLLGTLYTVAGDVKLQITFDKNHVSKYRLIGYENRVLATEDFTDDTKDAGEVGAGHQVTVCYELELCEGAEASPDTPSTWMTLATRHKRPGETISLLNEYSIGANERTEAGEDEIFLSCVIELCMILHESKYIGERTMEGIYDTLCELDLAAYPERAEFRELVGTLAGK